MVTKAELEAEVAELRRQLAEQSKPEKAGGEPEPEATDDADTPDEADTGAASEDLQKELQELLTGLEDLPHKNPLLFSLAAFVVGYLIGRSR